MIKRLGAMFTDWMFFDRANNDLVVDTASMYGGLAGQARAQAIFVRGENINHFRYFRDDSATADGRPLPAALHRWLSDDSPADLAEWTTPALPELEPPPAAATRGDAKPPEAALVFLPGIMGSHLAANGDKIWLDPVKLAIGRLTRIAMNTDAQVSEAGFVNLAYGRLADHLSATHTLIRFAYDWRQPIANLGKKLATTLRSALADNPDKPVRILAHSMGGLVVRAAFAHDKTLWDAIVARDGGRLVMLGTPNHGADLFVDTLLGQSDTIRTLARVDLRHDMQDILDIVAGFPGAVHLLPAPDFIDTGNTAARNYHDPETWNTLAALNDDFWFGRRLGGKPTADVKAAEVKTTAENLKAAIEGESYERDTMYPDFLKQARVEKNKAALQSFTYAKTAEAEHAKLYAQALQNLDDWKTARTFYVCQVCGYTTTQLDFAKCISCFSGKDKYDAVS